MHSIFIPQKTKFFEVEENDLHFLNPKKFKEFFEAVTIAFFLNRHIIRIN
jgi:hypothetical protein